MNTDLSAPLQDAPAAAPTDAPLVITPAGDADAPAWDAFVGAHAQASAFHWYGWRPALREVLGYDTLYLMARRGAQVVGVLPLAAVHSRLWGRSVTSLPFCSYGGPVTDCAQALAALEQAAREYAQARNAPFVEMRRTAAAHPEWPRQDLYVTFRKALPSTVDDMKAIPQKRRNMVRRGLTNGLSADVGRDVDTFFDLYAENARAHGTPALPKAFFVRLMAELGPRCDVLFVRDREGRAVSAILNLLHRDSLHAGFAGELPSARELAANDFKYWQLMRHALARGCTVFDFGRSKRGTGSFKFKELWGFEASPLHYEYMMLEGGQVPQNNPSNPKFELAMKVWSRLPRFVVDRLGPRLIHGLG